MNLHTIICRILPALAMMAAMAACALTRPPSPISILAPHIHVEASPDWPEVEWPLQIQRPTTDQMRDSDRLLVRYAASRLQVYGGVAWLDRMPDMLQSIMIRAFGDAGRFEGIGRAGDFRARYLLATEVRHFEAVDDGGPDLHVDIAVHANLIHHRTARTVAAQTFRHQITSDGRALDPLVDAFETALAELVDDLIGWTLEQGEAAGARMETRIGRERERRRPRDGR